MGECERCGVKGYKAETDNCRLIGGYQANLCNGCRNEWDEHVRSTPESDEIKDNAAEFRLLELNANAGKAPDPAEVRGLARQQADILAALFEIGKAFVASGVKVVAEDD